MIRNIKLIVLINLIILGICCNTYAMQVAITVDDLPVHGPLPPGETREKIAKQMLAVLKKHHLQHVYGFVIGQHVDAKTGKILNLWIENGQLLGNHTFSHLDLAQVSAPTYIANIGQNETVLKQYMPNDYKYFRYPYLAEGNTLAKRNAVRNYLFQHGYTIAPVTVDFADYEWNAPYARCMKKHDQKAIAWLEQSYLTQATNALLIAHALSNYLFQRDIKYVLLIHIGAFDAHMLDKLLTAYENNDVNFIPLTQAVNDPVYQINPNIARDRAYTFLNQVRLSKGLKNPAQVKELYSKLPEAKLNALCR